MSSILKRIFHKCKDNLEGPLYRWPKEGTTGRGKVWKNYRCSVCGRYYTTCGRDIYQIPCWDSTPMRKHLGAGK